MSVVIHNIQKSIQFNLKLFERDVRYLRRLLKVSHFHMGILCVENDYIADANEVYRQVNGPTDVLAFPFLQDLKPDMPLPDIPDAEMRILGDIVLGIPYIYDQCQFDNEKFEQTLNVMALHGMCHLIGYDHETKDQWQQMYNKELDILEQFNKKTGYKCKPLLGIGHG